MVLRALARVTTVLEVVEEAADHAGLLVAQTQEAVRMAAQAAPTAAPAPVVEMAL
jgi:hypothetical protein